MRGKNNDILNGNTPVIMLLHIFIFNAIFLYVSLFLSGL